MTKVSTTVRYDYITIRATYDNGARLNMTQSARGKKISCDGLTKAQVERIFNGWTKLGKGRTYGDTMEHLAKIVASSKSPDDLISVIDC
jgi:hypothetical protein